MWFGFEFAIGFMLAFVVVPAAVWLIIVSAQRIHRAYGHAMQTVVGRALAVIFVLGVCAAWIFTH